MSLPLKVLLALTLVAIGVARCNAQDQSPSEPGAIPAWQQLRTLDSYFPFRPPASVLDWEIRKDEVRTGLLVNLGLWPMPEKTPLNAVVHGRIERADYSVEKVYFESLPGFFVTGNLYRPIGDSPTKRPGVLCPHGHFRNGRFLWSTDEEIDAEIASGAEQFRSNARSILQAKCASLARMGCVVFHYDMIGYADSQQIPMAVAHDFAAARPEMEQPDHWGLFSPQAEHQLQSVMGLQTWNSIRALDFMETLPDVDPARIGVTGASGGGTQTFILCAIDPRPAVAFPAVMVSTAMQGGCTCENCSGLRVTAGNVDFAALFAPKPLGLTAADDWTREMKTKGFPELKKLYTLLGKPDNVSLLSRLEFGHNYNQVSREAMYAWFNQHLGLGLTDTSEREMEPLPPDQLTVYDAEHPVPPGGPEFEAEFLVRLKELNNRVLFPNDRLDETGSAKLREQIRIAAEHLIGLTTTNVLSIKQGRPFSPSPIPSSPALPVEEPEGGIPHRNLAVLWLSANPPGGVFDPESDHGRILRELQNAGYFAIAPDLSVVGPGVVGGRRQFADNLLVDNGRRAAGYTFGYNRTLVASRAYAILDTAAALAARLHQSADKPGMVIIADRPCSLPLALAAPLLPEGVVRAIRLTPPAGEFAGVTSLEDPGFQPGAARYGDVRGLLEFGATVPLVVLDGPEPKDLLGLEVAEALRPELPRLEAGNPGGTPGVEELLAWLTQFEE